MSIPVRLIFLMWLVFTIQFVFGVQWAFLGIQPRTFTGLIGIFTGPLIHGDILHIVSNTVPLLFLGWTLFLFYPAIGIRVMLSCYFLTNILIWILARPSIHIGASGVVYGVASFLIFVGFFRRDMISLVISIVIVLLYGGLVIGLLPNQPGVSWESHLIGAFVGAFTAYFFGVKTAGSGR